MAWSLVGLLAATIAAAVLSFYLARVNHTIPGKIGAAALCFTIFFFVNCAVCFAGCAVGSTMLPGLDFK